MEIVVCITTLVVALSCLMVNLLIAYMLWQHWRDKKPVQSVLPEETPEEAEARRLAAKAQAEYEQGFINLMNYGGQPFKGVKGE